MDRDARKRAPHHEDLAPEEARYRRRSSDIARRARRGGRTRRLTRRISKSEKVAHRGRAGLNRTNLFRLRRRGRCRSCSIRGNGCHRCFALGLLAPDFAARPDKIIGTAGGRRQRLALNQRSRCERIDRGGARAGTAEQLIGADRGCHQRQDWSGQRTRRRLTGQRVGVGRCRLGRQCNRRRTRSQQPRDFAFDIMGELARAGPGEVHAVVGTQAPDLAFEVRTLLQEAAGFVDKSVPDIDIGDAGLAGRIAIERVQTRRVGGRLCRCLGRICR